MAVIPPSLQDLLVARLDRMASNPEVVQIGAVIGREFSFPLLAAVCSLPPAELQMELDKLVGLVADRQGVARLDIDLDAVPVVDNVERRWPVVEHERRQVSAMDILGLDIDRRLTFAAAAGCKFCV
jgi:hypothetical protein